MKNRGCLIAFIVALAIAGLFAYAIKRVLTPRDLSKEDPRRVFESFVCSPPPQSVREINARGVVAFAGGSASIEFHIDPSDIDDLIRRGKFELADTRAAQWITEFKPEGLAGNVVRYVRINEGTSQTALFVSEDQRRAWFHEIQF